MLLTHFVAFRPHCPRCASAGRGTPALTVAAVLDGDATEIRAGILHCPGIACRHEYPIVDRIPLIVPDLRRLLGERGAELLLRQDLDPTLQTLLGDAIGPDGWLEAIRQPVSTYAWDAYAEFDPAEAPGDPRPGAAARCLDRLLELAEPSAAGLQLDAGCAAGRNAFSLAARDPGALVLGCDLNLALLRIAQGAARRGAVAYERRRIGLVYDRRSFPVTLAGCDRVDFWACDTAALPFATGTIGTLAALNLLDCVADPSALLASLGRCLAPAGSLLLGSPFDWTSRATPVEAWLGGHSQRGPTGGAAAPALQAALRAAGLRSRAEDPNWPWATRLHDRAQVAYRTHLLVVEHADASGQPGGP